MQLTEWEFACIHSLYVNADGWTCFFLFFEWIYTMTNCIDKNAKWMQQKNKKSKHILSTLIPYCVVCLVYTISSVFLLPFYYFSVFLLLLLFSRFFILKHEACTNYSLKWKKRYYIYVSLLILCCYSIKQRIANVHNLPFWFEFCFSWWFLFFWIWLMNRAGFSTVQNNLYFTIDQNRTHISFAFDCRFNEIRIT